MRSARSGGAKNGCSEAASPSAPGRLEMSRVAVSGEPRPFGGVRFGSGRARLDHEKVGEAGGAESSLADRGDVCQSPPGREARGDGVDLEVALEQKERPLVLEEELFGAGDAAVLEVRHVVSAEIKRDRA